MSSSNDGTLQSSPLVPQTLQSFSSVSKGHVLTIPLVQSLQLNAMNATTNDSVTQLEPPLQSFQTHENNDGNKQSNIQSSLQALSFSSVIPLPKPPAPASVEVLQAMASQECSATSSLSNIDLSVVEVPIIDFDVRSKTCYDIPIAPVEKSVINDGLFSTDHLSPHSSRLNVTSLCNASSNFMGARADYFVDTKSSANSSIFDTTSTSSNVPVLESMPVAAKVTNTPTNPRRYRAIRPLVCPSSEEIKTNPNLNEKWVENQNLNFFLDKPCSPDQSTVTSCSDTPVGLGKDFVGFDVDHSISVVNHLIESVDSHVDSAVITVNENSLSYASDRNCGDEMHFNGDDDIRDFVIENSIDSFPVRGIDNGEISQDIQFSDQFKSSLVSSFNEKGRDNELCSEPFSLGSESYVSYGSRKTALEAFPTYPNFLCIVCGKSEIVSQQKRLQSATVGLDQVLVVKILMNLLNTTSSKLYEKGEKICLHCLNTLHEIEILKDRIQKIEKSVKELYATTALWINKLATEESCDGEFLTRDLGVTKLPRSDSRVSCELDQECNSNLLINEDNVSYSSQRNLFPLTKPVTLENIYMETSSNEQYVSSRRRKQFRCLKCHTSFFSLDDRKVHMRRCKGGKVEPLKSRVHSKQNLDQMPTALDANYKISGGGLKGKNRCLNSHKCGECNKTFPSRTSLANHVSSHQTSFDCHVCFRYLTTKARLDAHLFKFHGIGEGKVKSVQCNLCDKSFQTKAGLCYHKNVAHQVGTKYVCEHCHKVYYYHVPYRSHMLFAHGKKKIVCETCGAMFFTVSKLNTHINAVHRNAQTWQCLKCDVKFTTSTAFRQHNLVKHQNTKHACDYCPAQFRKVSSLHSHLKEHSVYLCKACQITFVDEQLYNTHMLETHNRPILKPAKKRSYTSKKLRVKAATSDGMLSKSTKTVDISSQVHQINLNDILLSNSFSNSSNLQVLSNINLEGSSGKIRTFSLVNSDTGLEMPSNSNALPLTDDSSVINVGILNNIEISDSRTELYTVNGLDNHQNFDSESLTEIANLEANLSSNLPHAVTSFGADSEVGNPDGTAGVTQLVKRAVSSLQSSASDHQASVVPLDHTASLQAGVHDLDSTVNELSPPTVDIERSDDLSQSVVDIVPSVHHLDHSDKTVDPANIWIKENEWALLKTGTNDDNLGHLQNLPSSGIDDLDIGVIGGDIVDTNVINDSDAIDLDIHVPSADTTDQRLDNIDVDITGQ